jgi:hypothetical protein
MGGSNPFGSPATGRSGAAGPLFPEGGTYGAAPSVLPSLNQLMRGSFALPLSSPSSSFRFTYQDALRPNGSFNDLAHPSASAMFSTSDLGNGMFLSAGTTYGSHAGAGAPAASIGSNNNGQKHSGPSVALKLSF